MKKLTKLIKILTGRYDPLLDILGMQYAIARKSWESNRHYRKRLIVSITLFNVDGTLPQDVFESLS